MMFSNIVLAIITLLAFGAYYVHPKHISFLPFVGLLFPVLLLFHGLFLSYWIILKPKKIYVSLIILFIGLPHLKSYLGNPLRNKAEDMQAESHIGLMTFNIRNFSFKNQQKENFNKAEKLLRDSEIDILCLQEHHKIASDFIMTLKVFPNKVWIPKAGTAIYSNYPIHDSGSIDIGQTGNSITWADLLIEEQKVRCFCAHLESNKVSNKTKQIRTSETTEELVETSKFFFQRYNKSVHKRIDQNSLLLQKAAEFGGPVILMGDFNDAPLSYTYRMISAKYQDSFVNEGLGILSTYKASIPGLRIDYIFHSDHFSTLQYEVKKIGISDHYPVISHIKLKPE